MKRIVIIEDEPLTALKLKKNILLYNKSFKVEAVLASVEEALSYFDNNIEPDLLFSDIELNDGICFQIFDKHPLKCPIIFTTAYDEYWQNAFETNSIDYLLKPIKKSILFKSLDKLQQIESFYSDKQTNLQGLLELYNNKNSVKNRFLIKTGNHYDIVETSEIAFIFSEDKVSTIVSNSSKKHLTYDSLDKLDKQLD